MQAQDANGGAAAASTIFSRRCSRNSPCNRSKAESHLAALWPEVAEITRVVGDGQNMLHDVFVAAGAYQVPHNITT